MGRQFSPLMAGSFLGEARQIQQSVYPRIFLRSLSLASSTSSALAAVMSVGRNSRTL
jgi:hypothetical protein